MVDNTPIVLDIGSYSIKAGTAEDEAPTCVLRTIIGNKGDDKYYGESVLNNKESLDDFHYPITRGNIADFDDIENLLRYAFDENMQVDASAAPIILTEEALCPNLRKQNYAELLFEKFETPGLLFELTGNCALVPLDLSTGMTVDFGESFVSMFPFYNSTYLFNASDKQAFGGLDTSNNLATILKKSGIELDLQKDRELLNTIKADCSVPRIEGKEDTIKEYTLPDGRTVSINCCDVIEPLLVPMSIDKRNEMQGVAKMIVDCINKCPLDCKSDLFKQINLVGGAAKISGLSTRIKNDVEKILRDSNNRAEVAVNVYDNSDVLAWYGAACLGALGSTVELYATKDFYDEEGAQAVAMKFAREG
ncbi:actin, putative [Entamoeba invadens IP1]|uniref:Actin, putative n=1 Tax=Entamoeba invadens IP1 TaxID=370355 RepID=A0A0A1U2L6_ENTIV|nr:actin, putative [Entamoeba invadens IP1]ELP86888.1 actin, putative [Entamoeba invadens IP1]|eukprot:XP_004253659.1 actin, putative [Entamoeba invadens IP1]